MEEEWPSLGLDLEVKEEVVEVEEQTVDEGLQDSEWKRSRGTILRKEEAVEVEEIVDEGLKDM